MNLIRNIFRIIYYLSTVNPTVLRDILDRHYEDEVKKHNESGH